MSTTIKVASSQLGITEISGANANPQIIQYAKDCGFPDYKSDEVSWCSLFANWVALKSGLGGSNSLAARSWLNTGMAVAVPEPGDIVVFWRENRYSWKGHVGFFTGFSMDGNRVYCLGGNQGNQVSITAMTTDKVLGYRRLLEVTPHEFSHKNLKKGDTGIEVRHLQERLKQLGYNCGTSDGIFGAKTENALKEFQSTNHQVPISGVFHKVTREFMEKVLREG